MSRLFVLGCGAVSPAGWGREALAGAVAAEVPLATRELARPGWPVGLTIRPVPTPPAPLKHLANPRVRRTSPIAHYTVTAALEALGQDLDAVLARSKRLGIVYCTMSGCVNYSRRFYDEALRDPATASPLIFPETVFNSPASHLAAILGTPFLNYTLVGDPGVFLNGVALAAQWLGAGRIDSCLVVGAEEHDWLTADAFRLFSPQVVLGAGAGALYLSADPGAEPLAEVIGITDPRSFESSRSRFEAAALVRREFPRPEDHCLLVDGLQDASVFDRTEAAAWSDWEGDRCSPKKILGEGLMAGAAWQCVLAAEALKQSIRHRAAYVSIVGCNQQAIGAQFVPAKAVL